jgi:hypothetical protein
MKERTAVVGTALLSAAHIGFIMILILPLKNYKSEGPNVEVKTSWVATIHKGDIDRVIEVLRANGIPAGIPCGGRGAYQVHVAKSDLPRAREILSKDALERGYFVLFAVATIRPQDRWIPDEVNRPYAEVIKVPRYAEETAVGSVLRHRALAEIAVRCPRVARIRSLKTECLGDNESDDSIHFFEINLESRDHGEQGRETVYYQFAKELGPIPLNWLSIKGFMKP